MTRKLQLQLTTLALCLIGARVFADEAPPTPPSVDDIKACIRQMDLANAWRFEWKQLEIGVPRHARNSYEALYASAGSARANLFGYPVHVVFSVDGHAPIDSVYWLVRDPGGHWQIPAICTLP